MLMWIKNRHVGKLFILENIFRFSCRKSSGNPHSLKTISIILSRRVRAQVLADCVSGTNINKTSDRDEAAGFLADLNARTVVCSRFREWEDEILGEVCSLSG